MHILADADALPVSIREILFRAAEITGSPLVLVANIPLKLPRSPLISGIVVPAGPDEADDKIASMAQPGDLVVTADIPLADRAVKKGARVIDPRGNLISKDNISEKLTMRNLKEELRNCGVETGGPPPFTAKDIQAFANQLDRLITKNRML
jgi:uncharacterized protein YaiI (UPF0178 family)